MKIDLGTFRSGTHNGISFNRDASSRGEQTMPVLVFVVVSVSIVGGAVE
jgi:hypothetical protein